MQQDDDFWEYTKSLLLEYPFLATEVLECHIHCQGLTFLDAVYNCLI